MASVLGVAGCIYRTVTDESLPLFRRLLLAWAVFFQIVFSGRQAAAVKRLMEGAEPPRVEPPASPEPAATESTPCEDALVLLGLFQQEGRLIDFLQQELTGFEDAQIGAVVRSVHEGCRKVLRRHLDIRAIRAEEEGESIELAEDFNPHEYKLTGAVSAQAKPKGRLQHRGWIVSSIRLPRTAGEHASTVLCPAELEL